jgi:predicted nucleic acid-binding protein
MPVFVDTSAVLAFLSPTDAHHSRARAAFERLRTAEATLLTTSYVLVETYALVDRRLGREAARRFREDFAPLFDVVWVDAGLHERGLDVLFRSPRSISLVDAVSFVVCNQRGIDTAWAFDQHFEDEGLKSSG